MSTVYRNLTCTAVIASSLWGCGADPAPLEFVNGLDPAHPGYAGQERFLTDTWDTELLDEWPPAEFMLALMEDEPEVFGEQFAAFGFIPDPARDLPVGLARGVKDPERIHETCALCHVQRLDDGLWLGVPNTGLDIGRFRVEVNRRWVAAGHAPLMTELQETKALALGPGRTNAESSGYPDVVPADFPPYFELGQRQYLNYMGTGQDVRTEIHFAVFSFGAGSPNEETAKVPFPDEARIAPFIEFLGGLAPPPAPSQDAGEVARGRAVFEAERCGACHHLDDVSLDAVVTLDTSTTGVERLPGEDPALPNGSIRTSRAHRILQDGDGSGEGSGTDVGLGDLIAFIIGRGLAVRRTDGYRANTLRGLWATAPYLHNGSVPTLEALLTRPEDRPTRWMRGDFEVDTSRFGSSNEGHTFGTTLEAADKAALAAFLRSL
ncbi:MAG: hypothetical protein H6730_14215 [Deltaproteobacteria bacterium]|nr:hypothetical protein [Deltaproteobacteria bacterium]